MPPFKTVIKILVPRVDEAPRIVYEMLWYGWSGLMAKWVDAIRLSATDQRTIRATYNSSWVFPSPIIPW